MMLAVRLLEHQVLPLSPKELIEGLGISLVFWVIGIWMGRRHLKRHIVDPAAQQHEEQMAMHRKTHKHLKEQQ